MRFLIGLLGSWAGLCVATMIISAFNGSLGSLNAGWAVTNLIFAAVGAMLTFFFEKGQWSWATYAMTGVVTTGVVLFIGFCVIASAIAQAYGVHFGFVDFAITAVTSAACGALSGIGYRALNGVKAS